MGATTASEGENPAPRSTSAEDVTPNQSLRRRKICGPVNQARNRLRGGREGALVLFRQGQAGLQGNGPRNAELPGNSNAAETALKGGEALSNGAGREGCSDEEVVLIPQPDKRLDLRDFIALTTEGVGFDELGVAGTKTSEQSHLRSFGLPESAHTDTTVSSIGSDHDRELVQAGPVGNTEGDSRLRTEIRFPGILDFNSRFSSSHRSNVQNTPKALCASDATLSCSKSILPTKEGTCFAVQFQIDSREKQAAAQRDRSAYLEATAQKAQQYLPKRGTSLPSTSLQESLGNKHEGQSTSHHSAPAALIASNDPDVKQEEKETGEQAPSQPTEGFPIVDGPARLHNEIPPRPNPTWSTKYHSQAGDGVSHQCSGQGISVELDNYQKMQELFLLLSECVSFRDCYSKRDSDKTANHGRTRGSESRRHSSATSREEAPSCVPSPGSQALKERQKIFQEQINEIDDWYMDFRAALLYINRQLDAAVRYPLSRCYTKYPLMDISRTSRRHRDSFVHQLQAVKRALGDEPKVTGFNARVAARRAMLCRQKQESINSKLEMANLHSVLSLSKPQRGLPEGAVTLLKVWLFDNFLHPYPKDVDKDVLAARTGLTRGQVSNWFINARVRMWKPMIEDLYQHEFPDESDNTGAAEAEEDEVQQLRKRPLPFWQSVSPAAKRECHLSQPQASTSYDEQLHFARMLLIPENYLHQVAWQ